MRGITTIAVAGVVIAAAAGGATYALAQAEAERRLAEAIAEVRAALPPDAEFSIRETRVEPATGVARLRDVSLRRGGNAMSIAELTLAGLRDDGVAEAVAQGLRIADAAQTMTAERVVLAGLTVPRRRAAPEDKLGAAPAPPDFDPAAIRLDRGEIAALALDGEVTATLGGLMLEEYGAGRPSRLTLTALEGRGFDAGQVESFRLGRLVLQGVDLAAAAAAGVAGGPPPRSDGRQSLEAGPFALAGAGGGPLGGFESLRVVGEDGARPGVKTLDLALDGLRAELAGTQGEGLRRLGYTEAPTGDLGLQGSFDTGSGDLEVARLRLVGRGMGALSLSWRLAGVPPLDAVGDLDWARAMQTMRLVSAGLRYEEDTLFTRLLRQQAKEQRRTEAQMRQQWAQMAGMALAAPPGGAKPSPRLEALREAVTRFIREPRAIEIAAQPAKPLPLLELGGAMDGGPARAAETLGLSAAAK